MHHATRKADQCLREGRASPTRTRMHSDVVECGWLAQAVVAAAPSCCLKVIISVCQLVVEHVCMCFRSSDVSYRSVGCQIDVHHAQRPNQCANVHCRQTDSCFASPLP